MTPKSVLFYPSPLALTGGGKRGGLSTPLNPLSRVTIIFFSFSRFPIKIKIFSTFHNEISSLFIDIISFVYVDDSIDNRLQVGNIDNEGMLFNYFNQIIENLNQNKNWKSNAINVCIRFNDHNDNNYNVRLVPPSIIMWGWFLRVKRYTLMPTSSIIISH